MVEFNPILVHWRPKDIPEVQAGLQTIPCDQLHINYFPYPYPQRISNHFFRIHTEYTHIIVHPNDLVADHTHYEKIKYMVESENYPVCCGVAPVDTGKYRDFILVTKNLPDLDYDKRRYLWLSKNRYPNMIIQPPFAGHPFMTIRRDVMQKIGGLWVIPPEYAGQGMPLWESKGGFASDLALAHSLQKHNIKINCNTGIVMEHLRFHGTMQVGKKSPKVNLIKYKPSSQSWQKTKSQSSGWLQSHAREGPEPSSRPA